MKIVTRVVRCGRTTVEASVRQDRIHSHAGNGNRKGKVSRRSRFPQDVLCRMPGTQDDVRPKFRSGFEGVLSETHPRYAMGPVFGG